MNFLESQTIVNLAKAFAGECQAQNRYRLYAKKAKKDGYSALACEIEKIIENEKAHARVFYNHIVSRVTDGDMKNILIEAGYPFRKGTTVKNMEYAADGEKEENSEIYPSFADVAKEEGFSEIEASFRMIAEIEGCHNKFFDAIKKKLESGEFYQSDTPIKWKCEVCGYEHEGLTPWEICPVCSHPKGNVEIPPEFSQGK